MDERQLPPARHSSRTVAEVDVAVQVFAVAGIVLATFPERLRADGPVVAHATHAPSRSMTAAVGRR